MSAAPYATTSTPGTRGYPVPTARRCGTAPEVDLVAAADRDAKRLAAFTQRYGIAAVYTDAAEMLAKERLDIVAVATNTKMRADLTCLAVVYGAQGVVTEKPMAHTLEQADRMVTMCADAGVALGCGAISTTHPSFAKAKALVTSGAIGDVVSIEASGPGAQHQNWSYFVDSDPAWVIGIGDEPRRESGSDEFSGQGMMVTADGQVVHYRTGAPGVRITGSAGRDCLQLRAGVAALAARGRPGTHPARRDALAGAELHSPLRRHLLAR